MHNYTQEDRVLVQTGKEPWKLPVPCPIIASVRHSWAWLLRVEHCSGTQSPRGEATVGTRALFFCDCLANFLSYQILKRGWEQLFPRHLLDLRLSSHLIFTVPTLSAEAVQSRLTWQHEDLNLRPSFQVPNGALPPAAPPLSSFPISPDNSLSYLVAGFGDKK